MNYHLKDNLIVQPDNSTKCTFAETAIFDYCLPFTDQGKQTSVFRFRLQQTNGSLPFPYAAINRKLTFSVSSVFRSRNSGNMEMVTWKMETCSLALNPLSYHLPQSTTSPHECYVLSRWMLSSYYQDKSVYAY
jgi:hypothetical protein